MNFDVISPENKEELLKTIAEMQDKQFRFGAGYTDLLIELGGQSGNGLTVINLGRLSDSDFKTVQYYDIEIRIGALVTVKNLLDEEKIRALCPVLYRSAFKMASSQVRQVATVGGNICTASPAGDIATALVALEADCEILSTDGTIRTIPLKDFTIGVRQTVLKRDEILRSVVIKHNGSNANIHSDFIKIGVRLAMECSVVSLAYHIKTDDNDIIKNAGIAIGSAAPTIKFITSACDYLTGKNIMSITVEEAEKFAEHIMNYASPISDVRGSAWYRKEVLYNISKNLFNEIKQI